MTVEEYLEVTEKDSINERLFRSWEYFEQKLKDFRGILEYPNTYNRDYNEDLDFLLKHDKEAASKFLSIFEQLERLVRSHAKEMDARWDETQNIVISPEYREAEEKFIDEDYETWKKEHEERVKRLAEAENDSCDEQEEEALDEDYDDGYPEDKSWEDYTRTEILGINSYVA